MKLKTKLLLLAAFVVLAMPLVAGAGTIGNFPWVQHDGARMNAQGGYQIDDPGFCFESSGYTTRTTCTANVRPGTLDSATCGQSVCSDGTSATSTDCNNAGYAWFKKGAWSTANGGECRGTWTNVNFYTWTGTCSEPTFTNLSSCTNGTTATASSAWISNTNVWQPTNKNYPNGHSSMGSDRQGCLHCHNPGRGTTAAYQKPNYLLTGHRNMVRKVDGSVPGRNLGGPGFTSTNSDAFLGFTDVLATVPGGAAYTNLTDTNIYYIYGGWYRNIKEAQIKRATATAPAPSKVTSLTTNTYNNSSTSCASCHTTGYEIAQPAGDAVTLQPTTLGTGYKQWYYEGIQCARCHKGQPETMDYFDGGAVAHAHAPEVELATELCFQCHEQATAEPYQVMVSPSATNHTLYSNFTGHYRTNMFLASPHAKFSGGHTDVTDSSFYASNFKAKTFCAAPNNQYLTVTDCTSNGGTWNAAAEIDSTHNAGCVECHDVHTSSVDPDSLDPTNALSPIKSNAMCGVSCHSDKDVTKMAHPTGVGTPGDNITTDKGIMMACVTCHMGPGTVHLFNISTNAAYTPFVSGSNIAAVDAEAGYANAVSMSVDLACGQCHGGTSTAKAGIPYYTKAQLAVFAKGMHNTCTPDFNWNVSPTESLKVSFSASFTGSCDTSGGYNWDFGDAATGVGSPVSHTYAGATAVDVTLTVGGYSVTKSVTPVALNAAPVATRTALSVSNFTVTFTDTSTDAEDGNGAPLRARVNWGDGSVLEVQDAGTVFSHTYAAAGSYVVRHSAKDSGGLVTFSISSINALGQPVIGKKVTVPSKSTVSGSVVRLNGTTVMPGVSLRLMVGGAVKKMTTTDISGNFLFKGVLPGDYTVRAVKTGYIFVDQLLTVDGNETGVNFTANK